MLILRWLIFALLLASLLSFVFFAFTGDARYKRRGLFILKWTISAALAFFAVLIVQRVL
jgi:hypothetical protein